jgi:hypothetical protein
MNTGRKYAWKLSKKKPAGPRQQTIEEAFKLQEPPARPSIKAGHVATLQFWALLQDFAVLHKWPYKWNAGKTLAVDHPFLGRDPDTPSQQYNGADLHAIRLVPQLL